MADDHVGQFAVNPLEYRVGYPVNKISELIPGHIAHEGQYRPDNNNYNKGIDQKV
jgi:hypothetical protein